VLQYALSLKPDKERVFAMSILSFTKLACVALLAVVFVWASPASHAATGREIDVSADVALERFVQEVDGGGTLLKSAKGVLIMPNVFKAGIGIGGEYGEGALRVHGRTVDYYNLIAASWGLQLGAQKKTVILIFLQDQALQKFRMSKGFKIGGDASVALIKVGAGGMADSETFKQPIIGFVIGQKGLMYNLSLEGAKFTKIKR